ncbi:hypothetical protein [Kitasatospora sp. NPDC001527]|uniref:hypothetical protein n=1 Tax=Kitasatospora sp. NPDC001527 TaxID=3154519 RepID=UPI00331F0841
MDQIEEDYYRATRNHETELAGTGQNTVLDFGAGVDGWLQPFSSLLLLLRCDNGRPTGPGRVYRQIYVSGGGDSGLPERERTQLFADIARRTAAPPPRSSASRGAPTCGSPSGRPWWRGSFAGGDGEQAR